MGLATMATLFGPSVVALTGSRLFTQLQIIRSVETALHEHLAPGLQKMHLVASRLESNPYVRSVATVALDRLVYSEKGAMGAELMRHKQT